MKAIDKILAYYNHKIESDSESSYQRIESLESQLEELTVVIESTNPENAINDIINGEKALDVILKVQGHDMYINAATLLEAAIDTLKVQHEQREASFTPKLAKIRNEFAATLQRKEVIMNHHAKREPINDLIKSQFIAQFSALLSNLNDCPDNLVEELKTEIQEVPKVQTFGDLVN